LAKKEIVKECLGWCAEILYVNWLVNPAHTNLLLTLASLSDVVGCLHAQERVHLHSKGFLNAEGHVPGEISLAVQQSAAAAAVTERPAGLTISVRIKSPGWGGFFIGMAFTPFS
jgi:hypothetical protein